jgi:hypothetical protein
MQASYNLTSNWKHIPNRVNTLQTARGGKRGGSWEETSQKVLWLAESFQQLKDVLI